MTSAKGSTLVQTHHDGNRVRCWVPPKINLFLEVVRRLPTGYHELDTLFATVSPVDASHASNAPDVSAASSNPPVLDVVTIERSSGSTRIAFDGPQSTCPLSGRRIDAAGSTVQAAIRELERVLGATLPPVQIHVEKHIPVAAGLGGGSADAAATLRGLDALFDLGLDRRELHRVAAAIGADVPFFVGPSCVCRGLGRGDDLTDLEGVPFGGSTPTVLLAKPPVGVSTRDVFEALELSSTGSNDPRSLPSEVFCSNEWPTAVFNRLQRAAFEIHPDLQRFARVIESALTTAAGETSSGKQVEDENVTGKQPGGRPDCSPDQDGWQSDHDEWQSGSIWLTGSGSTFVVRSPARRRVRSLLEDSGFWTAEGELGRWRGD